MSFCMAKCRRAFRLFRHPFHIRSGRWSDYLPAGGVSSLCNRSGVWLHQSARHRIRLLGLFHLAVLLRDDFLFCLVEPRLKLFEIPWVKWINNAIVITTCAFTGYLFLTYLPDYLPGVTPLQQYLIVGLVLMAAVLSSTDIRYVKLLSLFSTWLFFALTLLVWQYSGLGSAALRTIFRN